MPRFFKKFTSSSKGFATLGDEPVDPVTENTDEEPEATVDVEENLRRMWLKAEAEAAAIRQEADRAREAEFAGMPPAEATRARKAHREHVEKSKQRQEARKTRTES